MSDHDMEEFLKGHRVNEAFDDLDDYVDVVFAENFKLADELKQVRAQLAQAQERVVELEKHWEHEANIMDCLQADVAQRDAEIAELREDRSVKDRYLGVLGFLCEHSVYMNDRDNCNETIREILEDAKNVFPHLKWRQMLNRFEISFTDDAAIAAAEAK